MKNIAEIDDSGDSSVVAEEHVVEIEVTVDDLGAQARPARRDPLHVSVEHRFDQVTTTDVLYGRNERTQTCGVSEVPSSSRPAAGWKKLRNASVRRACVGP